MLPQYVAAAPNDLHARSLYVTNQRSNTVSQYTFKEKGELKPDATPTASTGNEPQQLGVSTVGGKNFVYVAIAEDQHGGPGEVDEYEASPTTGELTLLATINAGHAAQALVVTQNNKCVYVADTGEFAGKGTVYEYEIEPSGKLKAVGEISGGAAPVGIAASPNSQNVYVLDDNPENNMHWYNANTSTCALRFEKSVSTGNHPDEVAVSRTGKNLYVTNGNVNTVGEYAINQLANPNRCSLRTKPSVLAKLPSASPSRPTAITFTSRTRVKTRCRSTKLKQVAL